MEQLLKEINLEALQLKYILILLGVLVVVDVITGIINAILSKEVDSSKMKQGIVGKLYELSIVALGLLLDKVFNVKVICMTMSIFYIAQEGLSILENTGKYISYPIIIKSIFIKLSEYSNKGDKNEQ